MKAQNSFNSNKDSKDTNYYKLLRADNENKIYLSNNENKKDNRN